MRRRGTMTTRHGRALAMAVGLPAGACASGPEPRDAPAPSPIASSDTDTAPSVQDVMELEFFAPLEPGTYSIDAATDPSPPLRVEYEIPADGWSMWIGAGKFGTET